MKKKTIIVISFSVLFDLYLLSGNYVATEQQALDIAIDADINTLQPEKEGYLTKEEYLTYISQTSDYYQYVEVEEHSTYWRVHFTRELDMGSDFVNSQMRKGRGGGYSIEISKYFSKIKPVGIYLN